VLGPARDTIHPSGTNGFPEWHPAIPADNSHIRVNPKAARMRFHT
jgi:hypothetical protein